MKVLVLEMVWKSIVSNKKTMDNLTEHYMIKESKQTEQMAMGVLRRGNIETPEEVINKLKAVDNSKNQKNLPFMAFFVATGTQDYNSFEEVFDKYTDLVEKNRVKPIQLSKKTGFKIGDKSFDEFLRFSEYIHGEYNKYSSSGKSSSAAADFKAETKPMWSGNGIEVYNADNVGKCIKYTQGHLTGRSYSFCIGQPGNTHYQSYRDMKASSFYFIVDRNRFKKQENGSVDLSDPLHIVVFDNTKHGVELTDADNRTGTIAEYDTEGYISYLQSKGVPVGQMINRAKTPEEEEEQKLLGSPNRSLEWFMNLPIDMKSKYIGRGHPLTDEQFDYLLGE